MQHLCPAPLRRIEPLRAWVHVVACNNRCDLMLDLLAAALGVGGILLMAGYAALCERI